MTRDQTQQEHLEEAAKRLISLAAAADVSGFSPAHLRYLLRRGIVWGQKIGRNWVTTEEAVREYKARGVRPGPKPRDEHGRV